ncbi:MAG: AI-2E family transporter [Clostridia bacterium]|nr:AI-2E family transporter [Clostridia bacterium]
MKSLDERVDSRLRRRERLNNFLYVLPAVFAAAVLFFLRKRLTHIIIPIAAALALYFFLVPLVSFLEKKCGVKRNAAIFTVFACLGVFLTAIISFAAPAVKENISDIAANLPALKEKLVMIAENLAAKLGIDTASFASGFSANDTGGGIGRDFGGIISRKLSEIIEAAASNALAGSFAGVFKIIFDLFSSIIITFYLLRDRESIGEYLLQLFPYSWRGFLTSTVDEIGKISASFIRGQLLIAVIVGMLETIGLWLLGSEYPFVFGIIGGLSNFIPYFGPFIGAIPAVVAALFDSPWRALWIVILFVVIQQIDNNFISPKIIEERHGIHPITTIIVVFIGGEFFGIGGFLFAIPIYAIIKCIVKRISELLIKKNTAE